ncbi:electron transfer flavoprotein subunit alpha/FixB family protein [Cellulomonas sp. C5510]|uniref:electron transfer flavoprotein subunit alpha/FixB family protein n=1 Tax=Cellulomonas sp. C5510 TaxID=2871170 RepID=UPI001C97596A|nr:electron transfer flavoprotein subunit alpha/FixB family protein [Cellulomonas sp. C5510]QZN86665.1 electron transfer flavoprotein subunit alpha/FixB family protein [Cellulomonas sp. C5510]
MSAGPGDARGPAGAREGGAWLVVADAGWRAALRVARGARSEVSAVVVGPRPLADAVAAAGVPVLWVEPGTGTPAEAYAGALAVQVAAEQPALLVGTGHPASRVLLGAAAALVGARLLTGAVDVVPVAVATGAAGGGGTGAVAPAWTVRRALLDGAVVETVDSPAPLALVVDVAAEDEDEGAATALSPGTVRPLAAAPAAMTLSTVPSAEPAGGLEDARVVVAFGRGVRSRDDVALIERLADALGAELACSMPVADDRGWLDRSRYVGRSGRHIAPRLYLAVGISGAPQHLEGVRGAKVVAAVDQDRAARIFRVADYGAVGDLYEVVPALITALQR